jgi:hypothetical protein
MSFINLRWKLKNKKILFEKLNKSTKLLIFLVLFVKVISQDGRRRSVAEVGYFRYFSLDHLCLKRKVCVM